MPSRPAILFCVIPSFCLSDAAGVTGFSGSLALILSSPIAQSPALLSWGGSRNRTVPDCIASRQCKARKNLGLDVRGYGVTSFRRSWTTGGMGIFSTIGAHAVAAGHRRKGLRTQRGSGGAGPELPPSAPWVHPGAGPRRFGSSLKDAAATRLLQGW